MKFSVGDRIRIKRSGEEGFVVAFIGSNMAEVQIDQTVFPIYLDEIEHPYLHWFTQKKKNTNKKIIKEQIPTEKKESQQQPVATGVHLMFMPVFGMVDMEERVEQFKIFIINQTSYNIKFDYDARLKDTSLFAHTILLSSFSNTYLHYIDWEQMAEVPKMIWKIEEQSSKKFMPAADVLKIRSAKLFEHIKSLQENNLPTFQYTLIHEFLPFKEEQPPFELKSVVPKTFRKVHSMKELPKYELDLHIEQLRPDFKQLIPQEIINIQLAELQKYLLLAYVHQQDKMVIIHGIGKGILRQEVHRLLSEQDFVGRFESGLQAGYGYGATVVYFKY